MSVNHLECGKRGFVMCSGASFESFQRAWPCNGFPRSADGVRFYFEPDGGLVDYDFVRHGGGIVPVPEGVDESAISALFDDCLKSGGFVLAPSVSYR